jgi:hypothetical protein
VLVILREMRVRRFGLRSALVLITVGTLAASGGCKTCGQGPASTSFSPSVAAPQQVSTACPSVSIDFKPKLADQHVRCVLQVNTSLALDVSSDPAWSFTLRNAGAVAQEFREPTTEIGETGVAPLLQDIDNSGTPVLLIVVGSGGTGGEPMAVWRLTGPPTRFVRAGKIFGFRRFYQTPEGFFGNYAHSSAASGIVQLYRWVDDKLVDVALLDLQVAEMPPDPHSGHDWVRNGNVLCGLNNEDDPAGARAARIAALQAAGIDPATAQQRFCTQPWVASIYK